MMMDEEALANQQQTIAPGEAPVAQEMPQEGIDPEMAAEKPVSREASPQEQKIFEVMAKQALMSLTSKEGTEMILAGAKSGDPSIALGEAVAQIVIGVQQAAGGSGVEIPDSSAQAAADVAVKTIAAVMSQSGFGDANEISGGALDIVKQKLAET